MKAEQFIKDYTKHCSNELCYEEGLDNLYEPWITPEQALAAVKIAKEELIDKACEYLEPILTEYAGFYVGGEILQHFKNYMEGE